MPKMKTPHRSSPTKAPPTKAQGKAKPPPKPKPKVWGPILWLGVKARVRKEMVARAEDNGPLNLSIELLEKHGCMEKGTLLVVPRREVEEV